MSSVVGEKPDTDWILSDPVSSLIRYWARRLSQSPGFNRSDRPDIEQDFRAHLLAKAAKFDSSRSQHSTFAERIIKNKVKSMRRAVLREMRDCRRTTSIEDVAEDGEGIPTSIAHVIAEADGRRHTGQRLPSATEVAQRRLDIAEVNRKLPPELRRMAALLSHVSPFAAARVMGISRRQAALYVATLRECYEERGIDVYSFRTKVVRKGVCNT